MPPLRLFISHAREDKVLADRLQALITGLFHTGPTSLVQVDHSSDESPGAGVTLAARWLDWILDVVRQTDVCIVILTADSVSAPWLTWEAGAVTGVAVATASQTATGGARARVIPLVFGISIDSVPAPLQQQQVVDGLHQAQVLQLLFLLHKLSSSSEPFSEPVVRRKVSVFVKQVEHALLGRTQRHPARLQVPSGTPVYFINKRQRLVLQPYDGQIAAHARLCCENFTGHLYQGWQLYPLQRGMYKIVSAAAGKMCVSVEQDSKKDGAGIILWEYEGHPSQHWELASDPGNPNTLSTVRLFNVNSRLCILPSPDDLYVVQEPFRGYDDQDWWFMTAPRLSEQ